MRRRILRSSLAVAVVAVLLLGVPLAIAAGLVAGQHAERDTHAVADAVESAVGQRLHARAPVTPDVFTGVPEGDYVTVRAPSGQTLIHGTPPDGRVFAISHVVAGTQVSVQRPRSAAYGDMLRAALLVLLGGAGAVAVAVSLGLRQGRRLAEPLVDLAARARRVGSGGAGPHFPRYGIEEVDGVAAALDRSTDRMARLVASERQFASDASHQLRTPLTALSMRLEEILHSDDPDAIREEARIALGQVERLGATVEHLLSVNRRTRTSTALPTLLDEVVRQQVEEWRPAFAALGRELRVVGARGLWICATPGGVSQVLATLLENSLVHGAGTVTIRRRRTGGSVVVEVADQGPGVPAELGPRIFERAVSGRSGTGLGLALARDIAEVDGARLELLTSRPAVFAMFLPVPETGRQRAREQVAVEQPSLQAGPQSQAARAVVTGSADPASSSSASPAPEAGVKTGVGGASAGTSGNTQRR